jgi:SAM-dependent methyltransferase
MHRSMDDETFARLFSAQYADFEDDLPLWLRLAGQAGGPILEVGCGAGRVLRALAGLGFEVTGIDTNPAMLFRAGDGLQEELRRHVRLVEQDVLALDLAERFRLILAPCNTLAGLADADLARALLRLRSHLLPEGKLAFEVPGPDQATGEADPDEPLAAFFDPASGNPVQVYAKQRADPGSRQVNVTWRYDELLPDGGVRSWSLPTTFHLRRSEEYASALELAGFTRVAFYCGYGLEPTGDDDQQMIVIAEA